MRREMALFLQIWVQLRVWKILYRLNITIILRNITSKWPSTKEIINIILICLNPYSNTYTSIKRLARKILINQNWSRIWIFLLHHPYVVLTLKATITVLNAFVIRGETWKVLAHMVPMSLFRRPAENRITWFHIL